MSKRYHVDSLPIILFGLSVGLIAASLVLFYRFGASGYFAIAGHPWHMFAPARSAASLPSSPLIEASESLAQSSLQPGQAQVFTIAARSNVTTKAEIKTWVTRPPNKEVWRSPDDQLTTFVAGKTVNSTYTYQVPANLPAGAYQVSFLITSANEQTDYVVKENNLEFNVQ